MKILRRSLLVLLLLVILCGAWVWWNRPQRVDMSGYVPAETLVYLEANSLPDIAGGIASTDAWKALNAPVGIKPNLSQVGWLNRLALWTGIGPAETVVLSRAQVAIAVMGFDTAEVGDTLKLKPRYAVVVETHTSAGGARAAVEKRVGEFARRAYADPRVEHRQVEGTEFVVWSEPGTTRHIVAAQLDSVAFIGNDERAVLDCMAVRRGLRQSLAGDAQIEQMRERLQGTGALAFGYVSASGAAKLLEVGLKVYAGQLSEDPRAQSAIASILPQLSSKVLGGAGWSARSTGGIIEDRYFLSLQSGAVERLRDPLALTENRPVSAGPFLPRETYSLTRYSVRDSLAAWRGLNSALTSQLDTLGAFIISRVLEGALRPYNIEQPNDFLRAIGSEIVTARLDDAGASTVTIVEVRDEKVLREMVARRLGARTRTERVGEAEMLVSTDEERGAASFIDGRLLITTATANIRRCLEARMRAQTLDTSDAFKEAARLASMNSPATALTYTDDKSSARTFMSAIAGQRGLSTGVFNEAEFERALNQLPYGVSATRLVEGGFEKTTRSSFGQLGALAAQFTTDSGSERAR